MIPRHFIQAALHFFCTLYHRKKVSLHPYALQPKRKFIPRHLIPMYFLPSALHTVFMSGETPEPPFASGGFLGGKPPEPPFAVRPSFVIISKTKNIILARFFHKAYVRYAHNAPWGGLWPPQTPPVDISKGVFFSRSPH